MSEALNKYKTFCENVTREGIEQFDQMFEANALFRDPFNHVRGVNAIKHIFTHMMDNFPRTKFTIIDHAQSDHYHYLRWDFQPDTNKTLVIDGMTQIHLGETQLIDEHIDYWDSASRLFAEVKPTKAPTRWLLNRLCADKSAQIHSEQLSQ